MFNAHKLSYLATVNPQSRLSYTHTYTRATGAALQLSRRLFPRLATRADA